MGFLTPAVTLLQGLPVPFITTLAVGCASFLVPLSAEAVGLKVHGTCLVNSDNPGQCARALGVSPVPANALIGAIGAIALIIVLLLVLLFFLRSWNSGVRTNPWSMAGIASLAGNHDVQIRAAGGRAAVSSVAQKVYGLGWYTGADGRPEYGFLLLDESGQSLGDSGETGPLNEADDDDSSIDMMLAAASKGRRRRPWAGSERYLPFMCLRHPWRIALILYLTGLMTFLLYYHLTLMNNARLWEFMNAHTFGVRFLFAVLGVVITFCWQAFFLSVTVMAPFSLMATRSHPADQSILMPRPTNPFYGIYLATKRSQPYLFVVSFIAILSEFLPIVLSNIPFNLSQTQTTETACSVISIIVLGIMIMTLSYSFFIRYPPMPADPRCVAGILYYVSQTQMVEDFRGMSQLDGKQRRRRILEQGKRYFYGVLTGAGNRRRLGVDSDLGPADERLVKEHRGSGSF